MIFFIYSEPNQNAPDYYLLGYVKERVYINRQETLEDLKDNIRSDIYAISPATLRSLMNNALVRASSFIAIEGKHLREVIFRI